ncbi:MAG: glutamate ligase domain-containing protein, partial [Candidatus Paceibacteria bacterium]
SFEKYYQAKQELFRRTKNLHVLNADSPYVNLFLKFPAKKKLLCSLRSRPNFKTYLLGDFNKSNILLAAETVKNYDVDSTIIQKSLGKIRSIPGRMEFIDGGQDFKVVVDYAHTPQSLEQVYQTLKPQKSKLICVLGAAGGGRDKWKRPVLGEIAAKYCDQIILTNEDPYDENPTQILQDIEAGISDSRFPSSNLYEILDRKEAIKKAMTLAQKNDIIIITGKGSETSIAVEDGRKIPWSDKEVVLELIKLIKEPNP